jgi:hypothetical protein
MILATIDFTRPPLGQCGSALRAGSWRRRWERVHTTGIALEAQDGFFQLRPRRREDAKKVRHIMDARLESVKSGEGVSMLGDANWSRWSSQGRAAGSRSCPGRSTLGSGRTGAPYRLRASGQRRRAAPHWEQPPRLVAQPSAWSNGCETPSCGASYRPATR